MEDANVSEESSEVEEDLFFAARRRKFRQFGYFAVAALIFTPILLGVWVFEARIERWLRGETDLFGEPSFSYQPVDDDVQGLERIHAELLPGWLVAEANREAWGLEQAEQAFGELDSALAGDPNLRKIVGEMKEILRANEQASNFDRLLYLMRSWSNYLSESGEPYMVQGNTLVTSNSSFFYIKSYEVEVDVRVQVGDDDYRSRVVRRLDTTNVREGYLGATSRGADGAVVLINRLYEFVLDDVLPLFANAPAKGWEAWAEPVRQELTALLPPEHVRALVDAQSELARIDAVFESIEERRSCGNRMVIAPPGHLGLAPSTLGDLERWATDDPLDLCPALTGDELDELRDASQALRENEAWHTALGALIAHISQGIAIHEARHVADDVRHDGLQKPLPCKVCDPRDGAPTRAELSAYLASFAWGPTPVTTFFQACTATDKRRGPHGRAMRHVLAGFEQTCLEGPPENIAQRSRELEADWFSRSERAAVPEDYPRILDLTGVQL